MSWIVDLRGRRGDLHVEIAFRLDASGLLIIGPNGAGKTTLLRTIAGARNGPGGRIVLNDRVLLDSSRGIDLAPEERRIAYVPQGFGLFPHMNVLENVAFGCARGEAGRERARRELKRFESLGLAERRPHELSAGEKQRVALARALAPEPDALLLDEPLAALDPGTRRRMRAFLAEYLTEARRPVMTVTHDIRDVRALGGMLLVIENGRVNARGTTEELQAQSLQDAKSEFVAEFFQE